MALGLVARLAAACRALRRLEAEGDEEGWSEAKLEAEAARSELQEAVRPLREPGYLQELGRKAEKARKRRQRLQRRKQEAEAAKEEEAARAAEREAEIDRWRAKCIQEVEEKNRVRPHPAVTPHGCCTSLKPAFGLMAPAGTGGSAVLSALGGFWRSPFGRLGCATAVSWPGGCS